MRSPTLPRRSPRPAGAPAARPAAADTAVQRSFDDLGTPLHEVTFVVLDLETTGGSVSDCGITEIGAVKVRGGECLGTFHTFVNPGMAIPPEITVLTGITQAMVYRAPRVEAVLPTLLEWLGGAVLVGHNVRFDQSFLDAALLRSGRPRLANRTLDTCALARRLVRDEVPNCKLGTLASRLRLDHQPSHRALDDALATNDLLHVLIERAAGLGVTGLDDLLLLPTLGGHADLAKLKLTERLPRAPGVYLFRGHQGEVLYVGKATDLRSRVRSYFSSDTRRKVGALVRETARFEHQVCANPLEAAVRELRLIHRHKPRYNRQFTRNDKPVYVTLTTDAFPRCTVVRAPSAKAPVHLGPLPSARVARLVVEAIETAAPLRRCTARVPAAPRDGRCTAAQLGVATCPCAGDISPAAYAVLVDRVVRGLTADASLLLDPLRDRMQSLALAERFEEAADVRDRAEALAGALRRQRRIEVLRDAGTVRVRVRGQGGLEIASGRLVRAWPEGHDPDAELAFAVHEPPRLPAEQQLLAGTARGAPIPHELADEAHVLASWLLTNAARVELEHCSSGLAEPFPPVPSFTPRPSRVLKPNA
jgi:DNA polymerase-3 subunit epsilon